MTPRHVRLPFIDTVDKAHQAVRQINHTAEVEGSKPIVFTTLVNMDVLKVIQEGCKGMLLDMFGTFVHPLEVELGIKSHHRVGRFPTSARARNTTTASKPSTSAWRTTTARATATWKAPT
jgi:regulator of PEP synthase PpsR (kinase-PPPase family)